MKGYIYGRYYTNGKERKTPQEIFAEQFVSDLQPKTIEDVENGLKSIFGPIFESMLKGELSAHLGYESNDHNPKDTTNRRNGSTKKTLKHTFYHGSIISTDKNL